MAIFRRAHTEMFLAPLSKIQIPSISEPRKIENDKSYVHIRLNSMHLDTGRIAWQRFYGSICSWFTLNTYGGSEAQFCTLLRPAHLMEVDKDSPARTLTVDLPLLGPIPYRGGELTIEIGLIATRYGDLAKPYLELLHRLSTVAGLPYVKAAMPFVDPVKAGIEGLLGISDTTRIELGLHRGWSELQTGTFLLSNLPPNSDIGGLKFDQHTYQPAAASLLIGQSWIIFTVGVENERDDWGKIPDLHDAHEKLRAATLNGPETEIKPRMEEFRRLALLSPDLISSDARRLIGKVEGRIAEVSKRALQTSRNQHGRIDIGDFKSLDLYDKATKRSSA